mgnify:CR=1 FL=1
MEIRRTDDGESRYAPRYDLSPEIRISLNLGAKIYQKYGQTVYGVLQENPYRLAEDISGVGFRIADEIASRIGIHTDSDYRIRSGMLYTLLQASGEGHIYLPKEELFSRASGLLGVRFLLHGKTSHGYGSRPETDPERNRRRCS